MTIGLNILGKLKRNYNILISSKLFNRFLYVCVLSILASLKDIFGVYIVSSFVDALASGNIELLLWIQLFALLLIGLLLTTSLNVVKNSISSGLEIFLRRRLRYSLLNTPIKHIYGTASSQIINICEREFLEIKKYYTQVIPNLISLISYLLFAFIYLCEKNVFIAIYTVAITLVVTPLLFKLQKKLKELNIEERNIADLRQDNIDEISNAHEFIKANSFETQIINLKKRVDAKYKKVKRNLFKEELNINILLCYISYLPGVSIALLGIFL